MYCQAPVDDMGKLCMVILTRYTRETLVYSEPDIIHPSNNISGETIEAINRVFRSSEAVVIWRLKSDNIVIIFKEEVMEYKKGDD